MCDLAREFFLGNLLLLGSFGIIQIVIMLLFVIMAQLCMARVHINIFVIFVQTAFHSFY